MGEVRKGRGGGREVKTLNGPYIGKQHLPVFSRTCFPLIIRYMQA